MFTVRWKRSALNELASVWMKADSEQRRRITAASQRIDRLLHDDPEQQGESRPLGRRILFVPPLGITFRINRQTSLVSVLHVWRFRQRGENSTSP
jgi:hypothetical protein